MASRKQIKKVIVLGSSGMLGNAATRYYQSKHYQVGAITRKQFDALTDKVDKLIPYLTGADFVVNCIGIIKPRIASMYPEEVLQVNGTYPKNLAKLARKLKVPFFHITTDCVYSGSKGNYDESDPFYIDDLYGLSKNAGENAECMTIRTSIIGEETNNHYSLLEWARSQKGQAVNGFTNHRWNGVTTLYLAELLEQIIQGNLYEEGIFHLYSPDSVNKFELLLLISKAYQLDLAISPTVAPQAVDRTLSSIFTLSKTLATKNLSTQLAEMNKFFQDN